MIGFAAHRVFDQQDASIIQVMGTYLARQLRGKLVASTLVQGEIFLKTWLRAPLKPISWCARTRVPAVYFTATRFHRIYPKLEAPEDNRRMWSSAERVARLVYGERTTLRPDTFVLENSYGPGSTFLPLRRRRTTPVDDAFARALNYDENQAIFLYCELNRLHILRYVVTSAVFRVINGFDLLAYRTLNWLRGGISARLEQRASSRAPFDVEPVVPRSRKSVPLSARAVWRGGARDDAPSSRDLTLR